MQIDSESSVRQTLGSDQTVVVADLQIFLTKATDFTRFKPSEMRPKLR